MKISVFKKRSMHSGYYGVYSDTDEMEILEEFLMSDVGCSDYGREQFAEWINDPESEDVSSNMSYLEKKEEKVYIYDIFNVFTEDYFETTKEQLSNIIINWVNLCKKNPREIILYIDGNKITLEGRFFEPSEFENYDFTKCKFDESLEKHLFDLNVAEYEGGFHHDYNWEQQKKRRIEILNKEKDKNGVISADLKFADGFYFNHAFFPAEWSRNKIKNEIVKKMANKPVAFFRTVELPGAIFKIWSVYERICIRIIVNNKYEILTAYPMFEDK